MELPIQLEFFRKLELYQELKSQDKHFSKGNENSAWEMEKDILQYSVFLHHHLGTPITVDHVAVQKNRVLRSDKFDAKDDLKDRGSLEHALPNLVQRGFATQNSSGSGIHFTKEGRLMGAVINDVREGKFLGSKFLGKNRYLIFSVITWATVISGILLLLFNLVNSICVSVSLWQK